MFTSAQEIIRSSGIGASEIAAVLGISPFGDAWTVYARKMKLVEPQEQTDEMYWGKQLEPVIARVFSERMDLTVEWFDRRFYNKTRPWQYASPDGFIRAETSERKRIAVLECKTAGLHQSGEWDRDTGNEDGVPEYYLAQVEWQMSTCGLDLAYIAVLIAGNDFRVYKIPHDPVLEEILLEEGENFWRHHLMTKVEPPIGGSDRARQYLQKRFPRDRETLRPATAAETEWLVEYAELRRLLGHIEARRKELENQITQAIGNAEGLHWARGKFTWKKPKDSSEIKWEELAQSQLVGFSAEEKAAFIEQYTHTIQGSRRIYFREQAAQ